MPPQLPETATSDPPILARSAISCKSCPSLSAPQPRCPCLLCGFAASRETNCSAEIGHRPAPAHDKTPASTDRWNDTAPTARSTAHERLATPSVLPPPCPGLRSFSEAGTASAIVITPMLIINAREPPYRRPPPALWPALDTYPPPHPGHCYFRQ